MADFQHSVAQRNTTQEFLRNKKVLHIFSTQLQMPQGHLRILAVLCEQIEMSSIFSATPDGRRQTRPIRAAMWNGAVRCIIKVRKPLQHCGTLQLLRHCSNLR